ncbi:hypothetical protein [Streptomyces carpinensis]|uniref:PqqD family protein n=1 Tax=Streptomyces carpinensis TaxID=66369 RepID=A0ABV1WDN2_9ACTN|nr:hypothetical protein [Streptomyces carpinensis]
MDVVIETGVTVAVADDGVLCLVSPDGAPYFYTPAATAMWIVLRRNFGSVRDAATTLAQAWEADSSAVRLLIEQQVGDWQEVGLVSTSTVRSRPI